MSGEGLATAIGVMSGTSMDGIDVALIDSDGEARVETGPAATFPYPEAVARAAARGRGRSGRGRQSRKRTSSAR